MSEQPSDLQLPDPADVDWDAELENLPRHEILIDIAYRRARGLVDQWFMLRAGDAIGFDGPSIAEDLVSFPVMELINGIGHDDTARVFEDWMTLLDRGITVGPTGTSDVHGDAGPAYHTQRDHTAPTPRRPD